MTDPIRIEIPMVNLNTGEPSGTGFVELTPRQYRAMFDPRDTPQSREDWLRFWERD